MFGSLFENYTARKLTDPCIDKLFSQRIFSDMQQNRSISWETAFGLLGGRERVRSRVRLRAHTLARQRARAPERARWRVRAGSRVQHHSKLSKGLADLSLS